MSPVVATIGQGALDYLTTEEVDYVREAQQVDLRIKVFMKIAERRLLAAEDPQSALLKKEEREWGVISTNSCAGVLKQYSRAIDEAIINFEEAYDRNPKDKHFLKALTIFCETITKHLQRLDALRSHIKDEATQQALEHVLDDVRLAYEDARQSADEFKAQDEQQKKEQRKG